MAKLLHLGNLFKIMIITSLGFAAAVSAGTVYNVGGTSGWDISSNMDSWEQDKTFYVGDTLWFQFSSSYESLVELTKPNYDACNTTDYIMQNSSGNVTVPLTSPGDRYFASGNRLYCLGGLKLQVHVIANQTAAPAAAPGAAEGPAPSALQGGGGGSKSNTNIPVSGADSGRLRGFVYMVIVVLGCLVWVPMLG